MGRVANLDPLYQPGTPVPERMDKQGYLQAQLAETIGDSAVLGAGATSAFLAYGFPVWLHSISIDNGGTVAWLKLFDTAVAPVAGAGTPLGSYEATPNAGRQLVFPMPQRFSLGLGFTLTLGRATADVAAPAGSAVNVTFHYRRIP